MILRFAPSGTVRLEQASFTCHTRPLSEVEEAYELDPIRDLRPVCSNHAIVHRRVPAFTTDEVHAFLKVHQAE